MNTVRHAVVALAAFAAGGLAGFFLRPQPPATVVEVVRPADGVVAPEQAPPPRAAKRVVIPKSEIYTTGNVPLPEPRYELVREELKRLGTQIGSANVFLVPGFIPPDAMVSACHVLRSGLPADHVYRLRDGHGWRDLDDNPAPLWVFVMLQCRSVSWNVHDVVCEGNRVRFSYSEFTPSGGGYTEASPQLYWFRLPTPEREDYLFELFDCDKGEVMLSRRQFVKPASPPQPLPPLDPNSAK